MTKTNSLPTPWYNKTINALQPVGMGDRTQECYARSVRQLLEYHNKNPRPITEQDRNGNRILTTLGYVNSFG